MRWRLRPRAVVRGAEDVRTVLAYARTLYEHQGFIYIGEYGENGWVEDYASTAARLSGTGAAGRSRRTAGGHLSGSWRPAGQASARPGVRLAADQGEPARGRGDGSTRR
jgi:hypothetical protein